MRGENALAKKDCQQSGQRRKYFGKRKSLLLVKGQIQGLLFLIFRTAFFEHAERTSFSLNSPYHRRLPLPRRYTFHHWQSERKFRGLMNQI